MIKSNMGFYIGDICYALSEEIYSGIWGAAEYKDSLDGYVVPAGTVVDGKALVEDLKFVVHRTAYGDGAYYDNNGFEYDVDAGVIGIVPMELCVDDVYMGRIVEIPGQAELEWLDGIFIVSIHSVDGGDNNPVEVFEIDTN